MKIIIIGPAHPFRGGIADTNESFCASLINAGYDASIITFTVQYPKLLFPGKTQLTTDKKPENISICRLINSTNPFNWLKIAKRINKLNPSLIIVRYWTPFLAPCLGTIARLLSKKIVLMAMCDNVIPHEKKMTDGFLTKYFVNPFDGFITLSKTTFEELNTFTNKPKTYFPHPININLGEKIPQEEAKKTLGLDVSVRYLLFFGLIREYKGLDLTLKALHKTNPNQLNIQLLVVGEFYEPMQKYIKLIDELGLNKNVKIVDEFVSTFDIRLFFSAADLIIQTYKTASQSGVSQMAFNFECPILVTNVGGLSEVVQHNKVGYVSEKDPKEIAEYIVDFFINERRNSFSENIKLLKSNYSWEKFVTEIIKLYEKIIQANKS